VIEYPDSDGEPMADNDPQYRCITDTRFGLEQHYRDKPDVYVGADLLIYYVEGDPGKNVAPDVLVALGVPKGNRRSYQIWAEGKPPDVLFEFASPRTWRADLGWKRGLYQGLGVSEYFLFDPGAEHFNPMLQGYRLSENIYQPIPPLEAKRGALGLYSEAMGLELWAKPNGGEGMVYVLRLYNPGAAEWLFTPEEEAQARRVAEAKLGELEAELARLRKA
jgi:Uma2 family endonuclease